MAEEVKLVATLARPKMLANANPQLNYVLLEVIPVGEGLPQSAPLNLCLVLDRSGSMAGQKIENLRRAVELVIDQLDPMDILSIVLFDDRAEVLVPATPVTDKNALKAKVKGITDRGGTEMSKGMQLGIQELQKHLTPDRVSRMVLLTDGQTYGDEDECQKLANQLAQLSVPLYAFGLGEDWNEDLLDALANATKSLGGFAEFIERPEQILRHFEFAVRSAKRVVARNAYLTLKLAQGVGPRQVWRVLPLIANLGYQPISDRDVQVPLGDLERDEGQAVLLEFSVTSKPKGVFRIMQAEVTYDLPHENRYGEKVKADIVMEFTDDAQAVQQVNPRVMNLVEKATAFKLQTRALDAARAGDISTATRLLRQSATRLLNIGETELAKLAEDEAARLEQGQQMTSTGTKRLRYETQRLTRPIPKQ
ncbi:MAG: VWA domain-containing protein [Armatimonadota bacterium]|jgi:Ca-activated chloride channel family protein|nr:VWA domain-containing protein [Armatimonadota bacterium]MDT7972736.1 VWA domain-containing protein [Armatimonadota bacterium]